ncbi:MAG: hypothetical protein COV08_01920 [Candidatus Vogelbacteria bacterium CG10_big_fil_rev_8_21_14_0_10_49_38]|uniref:Glycosyltransferase RgtA/B/C/D-like domain-containing protein n=1 Tax=Candidatus Vogelbacteria bacterium CG10_big_fil_rev_8_21_14_0_10_49_38 TaxID=1975043 RepID=A0A2H0RHH6_9BACT|nr:MAG: hypothetical protein BK006_01940 [bacterium CG10_49_38]PIR46011.1 MAG: hypothetical protein COV08_01920 [Candidatus Vogelbacteria bacterium CG10_big_fil_rev_8_21_14_0_10_49_38]
MSVARRALLISALLLVGGLVFSPHWFYPYPFHVDEWHHLAQARALFANNSHPEIGFQLFLRLLAPFDPVLIYKFLPALWAIFSALALFWLVYVRSKKDFWLAWWSVIFFATLKSNVNLLGLWFFTPLTFALPFVLLYLYFFTEGLERRSRQYLLAALAIMLGLLPVHAISVLFALPFLTLLVLLYYRDDLKRDWLFFATFLLVPLSGLIFYQWSAGLSWRELLSDLPAHLWFAKSWGVLELKNSPFELYSPIGYLLALAGAATIVWRRCWREQALFWLWPLSLLGSIAVYRIFDSSFLVPYQRNLFYLAIAWPYLSALGLLAWWRFLNQRVFPESQKIIIFGLAAVLSGLVILAAFRDYNLQPPGVALYQVIDDRDYAALRALAAWPKGRVMTDFFLGTALPAITPHRPVASIYFNRLYKEAVVEFFLTADCARRQELIATHRVRYVLSQETLTCVGELIYDQGPYLYQVKPNDDH